MVVMRPQTWHAWAGMSCDGGGALAEAVEGACGVGQLPVCAVVCAFGCGGGVDGDGVVAEADAEVEV